YAQNACIECHRREGGRLAEIVDVDWAKSVHYENNVPCQSCHGGDALLKREDFTTDEEFKQASHLTFNVEFLYLRDRIDASVAREGGNAYACGECHGSGIEEAQPNPHGGQEKRACIFSQYGGISFSRTRGIAYVCANCHAVSAEKHLGSPHGSFGAPSCLFCHGEGSHNIGRVSLKILDPRPREQLGRCSPCHPPHIMNVVKQIRDTLETTDTLIETSRTQFHELQDLRYRNLALEEMHGHLDSMRTNLRQVLHGSNIQEINELARSIKHVAKRTSYDYELVLALRDARARQTKVALGAAGLLMLLAAMLGLYLRLFCVRDAGGKDPPIAPTS
ncbi:MAG: hypothetical protein PVI86_19585, partial [Phycisphaerae bacterium]